MTIIFPIIENDEDRHYRHTEFYKHKCNEIWRPILLSPERSPEESYDEFSGIFCCSTHRNFS